MNLAEQLKIVPVLQYGDLNAGANLDTDSINMKNFSRATFIIQWHAIGVADSTLYVYSGATDGTCTTALTFRHAKGGAGLPPEAPKALRTIRYCALALIGFVALGEVFIILRRARGHGHFGGPHDCQRIGRQLHDDRRG